LVLTVLAFRSAPAAADLERAKNLFASGDFAAAAGEAAALKTADGYALAARAFLVRALFFLQGEASLEALYKAHDLALAGLEIDPDHTNNHLQAAGALGLQARVKNSSRLGRRSRYHLKAILKLDPDHPSALAATGGWHGEVLYRVGRVLGKIFFGADQKSVFRNFDRAIGLRPKQLSLRVAYAKTLLRFPARYRPKATSQLKAALALTPPDKLEGLSHVYGQLILEALEAGDKKRLKALLDDVPVVEIRIRTAALP
jgi:hypothetical protein